MQSQALRGVENSREQILAATWTVLESSPDLKASVADIAAAAGVSRQAVYLHFGNRANLLLEAVRHRDRTAAVPKAFIAAARHDPLPAALGDFVRGWFAYLPCIQPVARLLSAAARIDPEAQIAWDDRMSSLRALTGALAGRLAAACLLRPPWTAATAADWIWHRTHADGWHHLVEACGWPADAAAERIAASLEADLLTARRSRRRG